MSEKNRKRGLIGVGVLGLVLAGIAVIGWWGGRNGMSPTTQQAVNATKGSGGAASPAVPAAVGTTDPFAALQCQARQYEGALSLAVTFTQPIDRKADLNNFLQVFDAGAVSSKPDEDSESPALTSAHPSAVKAGEPAPNGKLIKGNWVVGDNPRIVYFPFVQPQRKYSVKFAANLPAQDGKGTLGHAAYCEVDLQAMPPSFYFPSRGVVLPAGQNGGLPVATVNVPEVDVQFLRVAPERMPELFDSVLGLKRNASSRNAIDESRDSEDDNWRYSSNRSLQGSVAGWDLDRLHTLATSVYEGRFLTDNKPNRRHVTFLPINRIKELREPGIYIAVMSQPGRFRYDYQVTYFYVSDIGLHIRRYPQQIEAYAVSLKTGEPIPGATIELVDKAGKSLAKASTDRHGQAQFEGSVARARLVRAVRERDLTVLALGEPALDLSEFEVGGYPSRYHNLFIYAGRNLYRPGETFTVSVLPRDPDGRMLTPSPLTAILKRPDGRVVQTMLWHPTQETPGYIEQTLNLPRDAQTGRWLLELRIDPAAATPDASWKFQVEEFLPERMKLLLASDQAILRPGEDWHVNVQGEYLYGAPAAGNRLLATLQVSRQRQALPQQWPGFIFGDVDDDARRSFATLPDMALDERGRARLSADPKTTGTHSPMQLRLSANLLESGGRPVVRSLERTLWPVDKLIAVHPLFDGDVTPQGAPAQLEVVRVDKQGNVAPLRQAQMRLYREERQYYWRFDDQRGWNNGYTETEELIDSRMIDILGRVQLTLPVNWGSYRLEIGDPETGAVMRYRFYAGWDAQDAERLGNRPDRVQTKLEGVPAKSGSPVYLTVTPPHDGLALVTVEGDCLLWSTWVAVKATGTRIEIPFNPSWRRHDLYVGAVVFRPGNAGDRVTPARALGLAFLPLASDERKLAVQITAPAQVQPQSKAVVHIKVKGAQSKQATVTLSAVDAGILNILQYATPDPFDNFFGKHRYAPELIDMYGKVIEQMDGTPGRLKWGGDASARRSDTRSLPKKVQLVDLFSGPVKLNDAGEANIALDLPDFNGTLRLMAVAFTADQYGSADTEMVVAAPLVAELDMPRFLTPGDQAAIALDVTNLSGTTQSLTIRPQAQPPLAITDDVRTLTLQDKQRTTLRYMATATGSYGLGLMRFTLDGQGGAKPLHIVRESALQVQPAYAPERQVRRFRLEPAQMLAAQNAWVSAYHPDSTTVSLIISSRPPFNVRKLLQGLLNYPYGCTEQTISATLPWVLLDAAEAQRYGLPSYSEQEKAQKVAGALARLAGMHNAAGAFSLWEGSPPDLWLTAYAVSFMQSARDQHFTMPPLVMQKPVQWLQEQLQQTAGNFGAWPANLRRDLETGGRLQPGDSTLLSEDHRRFAGLAAATLVLARDGEAPLSTARLLFDQYQERARSPLPLVQLAAAFKLMGDEGRTKAALDQAMTRGYGIGTSGNDDADEWLGDYGSGVRDLALSYAVMVEYGLQDERREVLLTQLVGRLDPRSYFSTQEQMALLLAARAAGSQGGPWASALTLAGVSSDLSGHEDQTISIPVAELASAQLRNTGGHVIYVEFDIEGSPRTPPARRADVIQVQRSWYWPDGRPWDGTALQTGDVLIVRLQATASQHIQNGLLVDRIPAGFEIENLNLGQGFNMEDWTLGGRRVAEALADPNIRHREFRDDRYVAAVTLGQGVVDVFYSVRVVTPGRYAVPSTVVEDMYRPELRGVGESWASVEIRDRSR